MLPMHTPQEQERDARSQRASLRIVERDGDKPLRESLRSRGVTIVTPNANATESVQMNQTTLTPQQAAEITPSLWSTKEFYVYYVAAMIIIPYMIYVPIYLSSDKRPEYPRYANRLVKGWMGGRLRDDSDHQYRLLRKNGVILMAVMTVYALLSHCIRWIAQQCRNTVYAKRIRLAFLGVTGLVFVTALHGANVMKLLLIALLNYVIASSAAWLPPAVVTCAVWMFNGAVLFLVFYTNGAPYKTLSLSLAWLDEHPGLIRRWYISYNFTMLRLVSFAMDYVWARSSRHQPVSAGSAGRESKVLSSKDRATWPHALSSYTFVTQITYLFYPPLFIAGPLMTFNDFYAQMCKPLHIPLRVIAGYALRCIVSVLSIEFMLHYMYVNAIKSEGNWDVYSPMELAILSFWALEIMWFKLAVPWRLFRLWALLDGVDVPENMIRAICNCPSAIRFWRAWHRSYNLWVVRYIYIPLGGSRHQALSSLVVFTFVALWHDLSFTLLAWAWLIVLFILPELLGRALVPAKVYGHRPWFRHVRALGTVANIFMMISANLVGFVIGIDGVRTVWSKMIETRDGWICLAQLIGVLWMAAQLMYEYRAEERRRGIWRAC